MPTMKLDYKRIFYFLRLKDGIHIFERKEIPQQMIITKLTYPIPNAVIAEQFVSILNANEEVND